MNNPAETFSPFLPAVFSVPEEEDRRRTFLVDKLSAMSDVINDKRIGVIAQQVENFDGTKWFYKTTKLTRNGYQTVAYIPSLPNATALTLTTSTNPAFPIMGIDPQFVVTSIIGSASKPCSTTGAGDGRYFSFMAQGDSRISFTMSDTTLVITTTIDMTAYIGLIIINYLREGI